MMYALEYMRKRKAYRLVPWTAPSRTLTPCQDPPSWTPATKSTSRQCDRWATRGAVQFQHATRTCVVAKFIFEKTIFLQFSETKSWILKTLSSVQTLLSIESDESEPESDDDECRRRGILISEKVEAFYYIVLSMKKYVWFEKDSLFRRVRNDEQCVSANCDKPRPIGPSWIHYFASCRHLKSTNE